MELMRMVAQENVGLKREVSDMKVALETEQQDHATLIQQADLLSVEIEALRDRLGDSTIDDDETMQAFEASWRVEAQAVAAEQTQFIGDLMSERREKVSVPLQYVA